MDTYLSANLTTTPEPDAGGLPLYTGYIGAAIAVVFFGSNFIPVKKFETGDGVFFQLILCIAIWIPSVILHAVRGFPRFWPLAMLGGFIWCTGNMMVVPIIQCIGMAMGLLIWGTTNMLMGWASGRFGWFGLDPEPPNNSTLNYLGVGLCVLSAATVTFIKPHIEEPHTPRAKSQPLDHDLTDEERDPLLAHSSTEVKPDVAIHPGPTNYASIGSATEHAAAGINNSDDTDSGKDSGDANSLTHKLTLTQRRILGIVLCLISGAFYGVNFAPVIYIKDNYGRYYGNCTQDPCVAKVSSKDLDYVFSHFTGILLTSVLYFVIYCIVMKNKPRVYPKAILPAFASGLMWSVADISFFLANEVLEEAIAFPIISAGPGIVASLWGLTVFKEIRGLQNMLILGVAFCFVLSGCILCGISK